MDRKRKSTTSQGVWSHGSPFWGGSAEMSKHFVPDLWVSLQFCGWKSARFRVAILSPIWFLFFMERLSEPFVGISPDSGERHVASRVCPGLDTLETAVCAEAAERASEQKAAGLGRTERFLFPSSCSHEGVACRGKARQPDSNRRSFQDSKKRPSRFSLSVVLQGKGSHSRAWRAGLLFALGGRDLRQDASAASGCGARGA